MKYYVYELVTIPDEKVCYIGKGTGKRMYMHKRNLTRASSSHEGLYRKLRESGKDFYPRKVFESDIELEAYAEETRRILAAGLQELLNSAVSHRTISDRVEARGIAISKGKKGKPLTEAHKAALRKSHVIDPETERKRAENVSVKMKQLWTDGEMKGNTGNKRPCLPDRAKKISDSKKGIPLSNEHKVALSASHRKPKSFQAIMLGRITRASNALVDSLVLILS